MNDFFSEDNRIILIITLGVALLLIMALTFIVFFYFSRKKILRKELEKKAVELAYQQQVLQAAITAQEAERSRIAQDLHDAVSARLNVISLTAHVLMDDPGILPEQKTTVKHILEVTAGTLESSRKIAHDLMPAILDKFGLKAALQELFEEFTRSKSLRIDHIVDELPRLDKSGALHLFRILQELISNSVRHGKADTLIVRLTAQSQGFTLDYRDNGVGFDPDASVKNTGIGLQNIKSRITMLNGTLHIESAQEQGSRFIIKCFYHE